MEEDVEQSNLDQLPQLIVSEDMRSYIYDMAKWANFLSVVGFVVSAFLILASFTIGPAMQANPDFSKAMSTSALTPSGIMFLCMLYAIAIFYPSLLLFKYSTKAKFGVLYGEQVSLDAAFSKMKSLFKYWGVVTMIIIVMYISIVILSALNGGT